MPMYSMFVKDYFISSAYIITNNTMALLEFYACKIIISILFRLIG